MGYVITIFQQNCMKILFIGCEENQSLTSSLHTLFPRPLFNVYRWLVTAIFLVSPSTMWKWNKKERLEFLSLHSPSLTLHNCIQLDHVLLRQEVFISTTSSFSKWCTVDCNPNEPLVTQSRELVVYIWNEGG